MQDRKRIKDAVAEGDKVYINKKKIMGLLGWLADCSLDEDEEMALAAIERYVKTVPVRGRIGMDATEFWNCVDAIVVSGFPEVDRAVGLWYADVTIPGERSIDDWEMLEWFDSAGYLRGDPEYDWVEEIAKEQNYEWFSEEEDEYGDVEDTSEIEDSIEVNMKKIICEACKKPVSLRDSFCGHCGSKFLIDGANARVPDKSDSHDLIPDWSQDLDSWYYLYEDPQALREFA